MVKVRIDNSIKAMKYSGDISVRLATRNDLESVQQCAQDAYAKYTERMNRKPAPMLADFARQIDKGQIFGAWNDSLFVGYVVLYPVGKSLHLESVALMPSQVGKGMGRALMEFVERCAQEQGLSSVELYTNAAMTENLTLYPKLGYVEIERKQQDGYDRVFFRKLV